MFVFRNLWQKIANQQYATAAADSARELACPSNSAIIAYISTKGYIFWILAF